jgi:hypothetical protein
MKKEKISVSGISLYILVLILLLVVVLLYWQNRVDLKNYQKNMDTMLDKIVSIETPKTQFIQKHRDAVMKINPKIDIVECVTILSLVYDNCKRLDINQELVLSVIENESSFYKEAKSHAGARGLMQVMPETGMLVAHYLGMVDYDLHDVEDNLKLGCCYLALLLEYHDEKMALAVYNAGKNRYALGLKYADDVLKDKKKWL